MRTALAKHIVLGSRERFDVLEVEQWYKGVAYLLVVPQEDQAVAIEDQGTEEDCTEPLENPRVLRPRVARLQ